MMTEFRQGNELYCVDNKPLPGNEVAPPLEEGAVYKVKQVLRVDGHDHIDVGLPSRYNFIRGYETGLELPKGDFIHWCHPSRFKIKIE